MVNEPFTIPATAADGDSFTFTAQIVGDLVEENTEQYIIRFTAENENDAFELSQVFVRIQDDGDGKKNNYAAIRFTLFDYSQCYLSHIYWRSFNKLFYSLTMQL